MWSDFRALWILDKHHTNSEKLKCGIAIVEHPLPASGTFGRTI
jgi:hypothetical protein